MKKQTDQQQKTQGKTTKDSHNQEQIQTTINKYNEEKKNEQN
ncbi:MAG: hypothetical protein NWE85_00040 [Candidatus Bathyarchaeota archaeon]|nr:hypothetical protein [Candidatus Bathyarchaeota archaeon]